MPVPIVIPTTLLPAARRALPPLAERRAVGVVVERRRQVERVADAVAQRKIPPAEVRRDDARCPSRDRADRVRRRPTPMKSARGIPVCRDRVEDHALDRAPRSDRQRPRRRARRSSGCSARQLLRLPSARHRADHDVGAAEIDADDVLLRFVTGHARTSGLSEKRARARIAASHRRAVELAHAATMSERTALRTVPIARTAGQGVDRQRPTHAARADRTRTPAPSDRRSRPSACPSPTRGAAARESLVTSTPQRPISSADARSDRRPVASIAPGDAGR